MGEKRIMEGENELQITPETNIGLLLDIYPQLEEVLISIAPAFIALRNPVMRRTVARVATIKQAASIGGISVSELVTRLRIEIGQAASGGEDSGTTGIYLTESLPEWCNEERVSIRIDITGQLAAGESPLSEVIDLAKSLKGTEVLELTAPLVPVPLLDILRKQGYRAVSLNDGERYLTYIGLAAG